MSEFTQFKMSFCQCDRCFRDSKNNINNNNYIDRPEGNKVTYTEVRWLFGDTCETDRSISGVFEWDYLHSDITSLGVS